MWGVGERGGLLDMGADGWSFGFVGRTRNQLHGILR